MSDFQNWKNVFYRAESGSVDERQALLQMATFAKTFGQWLNVYCESENDQVVQKTSMQQLLTLADEPSDATWTKKKDPLILSRWRMILEISEPESKEEFIAAQKIICLTRQKKLKEKEARMLNPVTPIKIQ